MRARTGLLLLVLSTTAALYVLYLRKLDELTPPPRPSSPAATAGPGAGSPITDGARAPAVEVVTVLGRLVDVEGGPFAGLRVVVRGPALSLEVRANADGAFELAGLPRVELTLDPCADFDPAEPLGVRRIAAAVPPLALDLRTGPARLELGALTVPRSRPFWVEGKVTLDEAWARAQGTWLGDVRLELAPPDPDDFHAPQRRPGDAPDWSRPPWCEALPAFPELGPDGSFRFGVETPHDPFVLRARVRRFEPVERLLWPTPDGVETEELRLPAGG